MDELEVKEHPVVHFRVSENTWLEAIVRYLVPPHQNTLDQGNAGATECKARSRAISEEQFKVSLLMDIRPI